MENDIAIMGWVLFIIFFLLAAVMAFKLDNVYEQKKILDYCGSKDYELVTVYNKNKMIILGYSCCQEITKEHYNKETGVFEYTKDKTCVFKPLKND